MKSLRKLGIGLLCLGLLSVGCSKNPVSDNGGGGPVGNSGQALSKDALTPEGTVTQTADGYDVQGTLKVQSDQGEVPLANADLQLVFDQDDKLVSIEGTAQIASPSDKITFENPVQAQVGYYSGKYINAHPEFELQVKPDRWYFVYYFAVALEMHIATNDDPNATQPISIKAPVGGKSIMIIDYDDPLMYSYGESDALGAYGEGTSEKGLIPFEAIQPLQGFNNFDGKSVRNGSFPVYGVIEVTGSMIRSKEFSFDILSDDPLASLTIGDKAGINGSFDFNVGVKDILSFTVPLGSASGGALYQASLGGVLGVMSFNGLADPDLSWWPNFLTFKPATQMRGEGFVNTNADFGLTLSGLWELDTPGKTQSAAGSLGLDKNAMTLTAQVAENGTSIDVIGHVYGDSSAFEVTLPDTYDFSPDGVLNRVDSELAQVQKAYDDLKKATQDYEFEFSLHGLRQALPYIVDTAKAKIASGVSSAKQQVKDAADWCDGPDLSGIDKLVKPYYDALNRLKAAALDTTDDNATRNEIEDALRDLAGMQYIDGSVKITGGVKVSLLCVDYSTTRSVKVKVLTDTQVDQLNWAADNVKYIATTSSVMIQAQQIYDALPAEETLQQVHDNIEQGLKLVPTVDGVGFVHTYATNNYAFYAILSGERQEVAQYELTPSAIADMLFDLLVAELQ